tara:strand:+ start:27 stop:905 length:879 start_codon:yes stop_codon:yes gene_type:complete
MKKYFISLLITSLLFSNFSKAQNDGAAAAAAAGALLAGFSIWKAIDDYQEYFENTAANFIITNHPEYDQFRVKVFKLSSKKRSDMGGMNVVPFSFVELKEGQPTNNKKILLMFSGSKKWNDFGVIYKEFSFKWLEINEWNKILSAYSQLNSPVTQSINNNLVPVYNKYKSISNSSKSSQSTSFVKNTYDIVIKRLTKTNYYNFYKDSLISISELNISSYGLKKDGKIIYPFYNLKGDDYLVADFSKDYKLIANERSMGLYLKNHYESILIQRRLMNKIHAFLNNLKEDEEEE